MKQIGKKIRKQNKTKQNSMNKNNTGHRKWFLGTEAPSTMGEENERGEEAKRGGQGYMMRVLNCGTNSIANGDPSEMCEHMNSAIRIALAALWRAGSRGAMPEGTGTIQEDFAVVPEGQ